MIDSHYSGSVGLLNSAQLDAAMSELREVEGVPITGIKVGGSVVRRKDNQRVKNAITQQKMQGFRSSRSI